MDYGISRFIQEFYHQRRIGRQDITHTAIVITLNENILNFNIVWFCYRDDGRERFNI